MAVIGAIVTMKSVSHFNVKVPIFLPRLVLAPLYIAFVVYGCSDRQKIHALCFMCFAPITPTLTHLPHPHHSPPTHRSQPHDACCLASFDLTVNLARYLSESSFATAMQSW